MKKLFFLLPGLMLFFACHKDEYTPPANYLGDHSIMQGQVTDPWGVPIAGAEVNCKVLAGTPFRDEYRFWIPGDTTDANGFYHIEHHDLNQIIGYDLYVGKDGYIDEAHAYAEPKYLNQDDFILRPYAWIKVHFKNTDPMDSQDFCQLYMSSYTLHSWNVKGISVDESKLFKGVGGSPTTMKWIVTKGGIETIFRDTLILSGHDTTTYLIEF